MASPNFASRTRFLFCARVSGPRTTVVTMFIWGPPRSFGSGFPTGDEEHHIFSRHVVHSLDLP